MIRIQNELAGLDLVELSELDGTLQGDLKTLPEGRYDKLKRSLIDNGIFYPFFVWLEGDAILDGNQRKKVIMQEWGSQLVPVVYISALDEDEAKEKLLLISSQFGQITEDGFKAFVPDYDWAVANASFDGLPFTFHEWESAPPIPKTEIKAMWEGMPEFEAKNLYAGAQKLTLTVHSDLEGLAKALGKPLTPTTKYIHWPEGIKFESKEWEYDV